MPYRLCALTSAQLKLSSVRFMQQPQKKTPRVIWHEGTTYHPTESGNNVDKSRLLAVPYPHPRNTLDLLAILSNLAIRQTAPSAVNTSASLKLGVVSVLLDPVDSLAGDDYINRTMNKNRTSSLEIVWSYKR